MGGQGLFVFYLYECLLVVLACESLHVCTVLFGAVNMHGFVLKFLWAIKSI